MLAEFEEEAGVQPAPQPNSLLRSQSERGLRGDVETELA